MIYCLCVFKKSDNEIDCDEKFCNKRNELNCNIIHDNCDSENEMNKYWLKLCTILFNVVY